MQKFFLFVLILLFVGCDVKKKHVQDGSTRTVHCFKEIESDGDIFYWYYFANSNNTSSTSYSTYTSRVPMSDFKSISWSTSTTNPVIAIRSEDPNSKVEPEPNEEAEVAEDASPGVDEAADAADASSDGGGTSESGSSDAGNSDAGGSDGGSDGGGGDGGGGGD